MPVFKCANGKYRIGGGECIYDSEEKANKVWMGLQESFADSYNDYPQAAVDNAKRALKYVAENGWGSCGTPVGKARANQLANKENITRDTIARMSSFVRHQNSKDTPYGKGCGKLMWDCWGGTEGIEWASKKLEQIDKQGFAVVGKRGAIVGSPKAPKSGSENKNPKGEGSASGKASGKRGAEVTAGQEKTLQAKADEFNKKESNVKYGKAGLGALKSVFQRGLGAFNVSHSPVVSSPSQWAFARVNAFLYLLKNGRPQNSKYTGDFDLLPNKHPKANK